MSSWRSLVGIAMVAVPTLAAACVEGAPRGEAITLEKASESSQRGEQASMQIIGAGWFRSLTVEKDGGTSDDTTVTLELDGAPMISTSFAILKNAWNQIGTASIVADVRTVGDKQVMTIWYSPELMFRAFASVRVDVNETGVASVRIRSIMNKPGPHDKHLTGTAVALPTFK